MIEDISVGTQSLLVSGEPIPADSFSQQIEGEDEGRAFDFPLAQVGCNITLSVRNKRSTPRLFAASLFGFDTRR